MIVIFSLRKLQNLIADLKKISAGDFFLKLSVFSSGMGSKLIEAINQALDGLRQELMFFQRQSTQIQAVFNSAVEGVVAVDEQKKIFAVNPAAEKIFNLVGQEVKDRFFWEVIRNNDIFQIIDQVLNTGKMVSKELNSLWPRNTVFSVSASPIFKQGSIAGCVLIFYDISEIRRLEKMRSEFVANVSHELKTPLTSIKGFVETLQDDENISSQDRKRYLKIVADHADRLEILINDLLELAHLESKEILITKQKFEIGQLVDEIFKDFFSLAANCKIKLENLVDPKLSVFADKKLLQRALVNLIENGIKFGKSSGWVKVYCQENDEAIKIIVEDDGMGIPQEDLPRIFERFYRVDKARTRKIGGTGLGLSIVKHIVELHNGLVKVESTQEIGSKFWIILPK